MTKPFLPKIRRFIDFGNHQGDDTSDAESEYQNIRNIIISIERNGCLAKIATGDRFSDCFSFEEDTGILNKCGYCILKEKGII